MTQLVPGQNIALSNQTAYRLTMDVSSWHWDVAIQEDGLGTVYLTPENCSGLAKTEQELLLNLPDIPDSVAKIVVFIVSMGPNTETRAASGQLAEMMTGTETLKVLWDSNSRSENALIFLEFYRRNGSWKCRFVAQGYSDGPERLYQQLGLPAPDTLAEKNEALRQDHQADQPSGISMDKNQASEGPMVSGDRALIMMKWKKVSAEHAPTTRFFMGSDFDVISDLRIGGFYQLYNGQRGIVQSYGETLEGSFDGVPYMLATRSTEKHFEQLQINPRFQHKMHRYLIYAFMLEGHDRWNGLSAEVNFHIPGLAETTFRPDSLMAKPICAIAMLEFINSAPKLTPIMDYFHSLPEMDQAFGWGLPWRCDTQDNED